MRRFSTALMLVFAVLWLGGRVATAGDCCSQNRAASPSVKHATAQPSIESRIESSTESRIQPSIESCSESSVDASRIASCCAAEAGSCCGSRVKLVGAGGCASGCCTANADGVGCCGGCACSESSAPELRAQHEQRQEEHDVGDDADVAAPKSAVSSAAIASQGATRSAPVSIEAPPGVRRHGHVVDARVLPLRD